ncbi:MAG TPA: GTPase domain-containing protein, partial [Planctomycetaceae bacterium]|nr:GTPase domain-containing protein [Planctomycetaceae bacterium]
HETLRQKLLPQLGDHAYLVVAVVGGTNIGKSVIFNHLAGFAASSVSPMASGTKHPVCLVPPGFEQKSDLTDVFSDFKLEAWSAPERALAETSEHLLFWKSSPATPQNLLILDTPDIDSDAPVNWDRADKIRRAADVLIAVLTQQKYNDAAVKQFFRKAAAEDKAILIVFNQCDLVEDEQYWPLWLEKFCSETGILPEYVYIAPRDRDAARENRLPFYVRSWPATGETPSENPHNLMQDLSQLHFAEIKLRSLRGSLRNLLDETEGVPAWLGELDRRSGIYRAATAHLAADKLAGSDHWPAVPNAVLVESIRVWWRGRREGWSRSVHEFYNTISDGVLWPFRKVKESIQGPQEPPFETYRKQEWSAILETVENIFDRLEFISHTDNPVLAERLKSLLDGQSRADLLKLLEDAHAKVNFEEEFPRLVNVEMDKFREESPNFYQFLKKLDQLGAMVRPAASVALFLVGFGPGGDLAAQAVANTAFGTVVHVTGDVVGGTAVAAVGDAAVSNTASSLSANIEARFRALHTTFIAQRATWLLELMQKFLWGDFLDDLNSGAMLAESEEFLAVRSILEELAPTVAALESQTPTPSPSDS